MNTQVKAIENVKTESTIGTALLLATFRISVIVTLLVVGGIGLFAVASLIGGAVAAGGPVELLQGFFQAISGR